jgi:hypothetical protein
MLAEVPPEQFDVELHRRVREHLLGHDQTADRELVGVLAELDARAAQEAIDEISAKEALLGLSERALERELAGARDDSRRTTELQHQRARLREAKSELA